MDSKRFVEALWLEEKGDTTKIVSRLRSVETSGIPAVLKKRVDEFDVDYNCITIVDDAFSKVLQICRDNGILGGDSALGAIPVLFRWNNYDTEANRAYVSDRIFKHRGESVFLLDEDIRSYHTPPDGLYVMGFYSDSIGYHVVDGSSCELLYTNNLTEVFWFAVLTCEYLLVGAKTPTITPALALTNEDKKALFETYIQTIESKSDGASETWPRIMAFPGKPGCFANSCLKLQNTARREVAVAFVECWKDVKTIVEYGSSEGDGSADSSEVKTK